MKRFIQLLLLVCVCTFSQLRAAENTISVLAQIDSPTATTQDFHSLAHGFPALSIDRQHLVIAVTESYGPVDFYSLLLKIFDAHQKKFTREEIIVTESDNQKIQQKTLSTDEIKARITKANYWLKQQGFSMMRVLLDESSPLIPKIIKGEEEVLELMSENLHIQFSRKTSVLTIVETPTGRVRVKRVLAPTQAPTDSPCGETPAYPGGIWTDEQHGLFVLKVVHIGASDSCDSADRWFVD